MKIPTMVIGFAIGLESVHFSDDILSSNIIALLLNKIFLLTSKKSNNVGGQMSSLK